MAYVIIAVCFGLSGGIIGKLKGSSFTLWFLISGLVPFLGLLAANLSMGQWLSLPMILIGIAMLVWSYRRAGNGAKNQAHA